jgi:hypothetical protein
MRGLNLWTVPYREEILEGSINFKHIRHRIIDFVVAGVKDAQSVYRNETPTVHECVLSWCVKTISSSYHLGIYKEEVSKTVNTAT